ncbi:MAG: zinc-binding dehydrogenase [Anaerolineales bacterium]|jgi:L-iditol 2-dehydrogenase
MPNNDRMLAAVMTGPRQIEVRSMPKPSLRPEHVLVRITACAICTFEQRAYTGQQKIQYPVVGGHEIVGEIEGWAEGVSSDLQVGDQVSMIESSCGYCEWCRQGINIFCKHRPGRMGYQGIIGPWGFSQYVNLHISAVHRFPRRVPDQVGVFFEPLSCAVHGVRLGRVGMADDVVIVGGGAMGLLNMLVVKALGARVFLTELQPKRLEKARELGATEVIDASKEDPAEKVMELTDGKGADAVIVTAGSGEANEQALGMIARRGRLVLFASAHPPTPMKIDPNDMHRREYMVIGAKSKSQHDAQIAAKMLSNKVIDPSPLIEETRPLEEIEQAIQRAAAPDSYRVIVRPWK